MESISANVRTQQTGKGSARKLRATGRIPGVVYGGGAAAIRIDVDPGELVDIFRKSLNRNTVLTLDLGTEKRSCVVREVQRHPLSRDLLHVDFLEVVSGREIEVTVPIRAVGKAAGLELGGKLTLIRRSLSVKCSYEKIPEFLPVDVAGLRVGDVIRASEVPMPDGVRRADDQDYNVISMKGKRVAVQTAEAEAESDAPAAE